MISYMLGDVDGMWIVSFFYRDPIYYMKGSSRVKGVELSSSENWSSCAYDSNFWDLNDNMVMDLFHPF
jgi:hypothetical protein